MKRTVFTLMLSAVVLLTVGCVPYWTYHDVRVERDGFKEIESKINAKAMKIGKYQKLKAEIEEIKIQRDKYMAIARELGELVESPEWKQTWGEAVNEIIVKQPAPAPGQPVGESGLFVFRPDGTLLLSNDLLFTSGSANLKKAAIPKIRELAAILKRNEYRNTIVRVEGHTDGQPVRATIRTMKNNWRLSALRAYAVLHELAKAGVSEKRLCGVFWGEHRNLVYNPPGKAVKKNRRVEIRLVEKK